MYPTDFLVSTATMTPIQGWSYTQLLMYAWTNGGIPDDREACSILTRCPLSERDWAIIRGRFEPVAEPLAKPMASLVNPRMERERVKVMERHNERSESGKRGADARWSGKNGSANGSGNGSANGEPMATTTVTTTTDLKTPLPLYKGGRRLRRAEIKAAQEADPNWVPF
jgi:uncharacterized protein YdaU (DUF1376 family)